MRIWRRKPHAIVGAGRGSALVLSRLVTLALVVGLAQPLGCAEGPDGESARGPAPKQQLSADGVSNLETPTKAEREVPPPVEPAPARPEAASEAPKILAELEADPAYQGIWDDPERRADRDLFLLGLSAVLAEGAVTQRVVGALDEQNLKAAVSRPISILHRTGTLPDSVIASARAHIAAVRDEEGRGLWTKRGDKKLRDAIALAVYLDPGDPTLLRELLDARASGSWLSWAGSGKPARPWIATEAGALDRLALLAELTEAETARRKFLAVAELPEDADCAAVAKLFGPTSKKSSAQMEEMWQEYKGRRFSWRVRITDVSTAPIGDGYSVQAKCVGSRSLVQDIQLEFPASAKSHALGLEKGSMAELEGVLTNYTQAFGLIADGHAPR